MPIFIEFDKVTRIIKRVITADKQPPNMAHLSYQEILDDAEIDLSLSIDDIIHSLKKFRKVENKKAEETTKKDKEEPVIFIEV